MALIHKWGSPVTNKLVLQFVYSLIVCEGMIACKSCICGWQDLDNEHEKSASQRCLRVGIHIFG